MVASGVIFVGLHVSDSMDSAIRDSNKDKGGIILLILSLVSVMGVLP